MNKNIRETNDATNKRIDSTILNICIVAVPILLTIALLQWKPEQVLLSLILV